MTSGSSCSFVRASTLQRSRNTLTTGYENLDDLMGGLAGGQLYLFYGKVPFLDHLVHRLIVRGSMEGKVAYMNNTDYYHEKTLLEADLLASHAKREGIATSSVLGNVFFVAAYSEFRQPKSTDALAAAIKAEPLTKIIFAHNISTFLTGGGSKAEALESINRSISLLWHLAVERDLIMVVTASTDALGSSLMAGLASVIVFFPSFPPSFSPEGGVRAVLMKHPGKVTPAEASISSFSSSGSSRGEFMGRVTLPFRQMYQETLEQLRKDYVSLLRDPENRKGFDLLLREAWDKEHAAMGNSGQPLVLDALNLTANLHNSGAIASLREALKESNRQIAVLETKVREMESMLASPAKEKAAETPGDGCHGRDEGLAP